MNALRLAPDLVLPVDAVTQTIAVLAKRRAGKSYLARRFAEQLHHTHQQVVILDPKGDWWGIRSAADGKRPGLPIVILGGERGDVPLEPGAGEVVAKLVVEERVSVLIDLSLLRKHEVATFAAIFLETLYRLKAREVYRTPMMLIIDEADAIAPQRPEANEARMLGAAEDIVRRGGQRGIGCTVVTQRSAVLNKNVLTQAQMMVALRTIAPQDLAAMNAWIDVHGTREQRDTLMESLPSLPQGDAWFWSPGWPTDAGIFQRAHVLPIETFDSGATPKPGEKRVEPKNLADVDLVALQRQMAATIERAKADDPKELRREITDLRRQLAAKAPAAKPERVEVPVLPAQDLARLERVTAALETRTSQLAQAQQLVASELAGVKAALARLRQPPPVQPPRAAVQPAQRVPRQAAARRSEGNDGTSNAEQRVLDAVAWWRGAGVTGPTRHQVAFVAGYTVNGHFNNIVGGLRSKGLVDYPGQGGVALTDAGAKAARPSDETPTREALIAKVLAILDPMPGKIFNAVADVDRDLTRDELAEMTGYTVNGHFNNMVGSLHSLGVIEYPHRGGVRLGAMFEALG